jgi:hypothetical protein
LTEIAEAQNHFSAGPGHQNSSAGGTLKQKNLIQLAPPSNHPGGKDLVAYLDLPR